MVVVLLFVVEPPGELTSVGQAPGWATTRVMLVLVGRFKPCGMPGSGLGLEIMEGEALVVVDVEELSK